MMPATEPYTFASRRSGARSLRGMVISCDPLATQAGITVLRNGGNAADAAIACNAVLGVTQFSSTGLGGDLFLLYNDAKTRTVSSLNASGTSPMALTLEALHTVSARRSPATSTMADTAHARHPLCITVPGAVDGWRQLHERYGSMPWSRLFSDAIHYASNGFAVQPVFLAKWQKHQSELARWGATEYACGLAGGMGRMPALGRVLDGIANEGARFFYEGDCAHQIAKDVAKAGGVLTERDMAHYSAEWNIPIRCNYRDATVWECPPNGQGIVALHALSILESFDLKRLPWNSPDRIHLQVEALRIAFALARQQVGDAQPCKEAIDMLLSPDSVRRHASLIDPRIALQPPGWGTPFATTNTVHQTVVDSEGNACSLMSSLFMSFGTGIAANGVLMQNRGACFSLTEGHPNAAAGGKRPYHTIIPSIVTRDGALLATVGVTGGYMQPQGHVQLICGLLDDGAAPQTLVERSRFCLSNENHGCHLQLEAGLPGATGDALKALGHAVQWLSGAERTTFGDGHVIVRAPDNGLLMGGADPRKDGAAACF